MLSNPISIKDYLETCLKSLREVLEGRFTALEIRLAEFEQRMLGSLETANGKTESVEKRVETLEAFKAELKNKMWGVAAAFTVVMALMQVAIKVFLR